MLDYTGKDIYCDLIIPRKIDIEVLKETDTVLAFKHTKPHWPTHIVVVPKTHISSLLELDKSSDIAKDLLVVIQEVAAVTKKEKGSCRVLSNVGDYQDSKHLHFHVSEGSPLK